MWFIYCISNHFLSRPGRHYKRDISNQAPIKPDEEKSDKEKEMGKTIALVACVSKKRNLPQPAKDLYCSEWFIKASKYAARHSTIWYILSAKYGLISPNAVIEQYNETLKTMSKLKRTQWSASVIQDLKKVLEPGDQVVVLAGRTYREFLIEPLLEMGCKVIIPMEGLGIGQQLSWLKQQMI